MKKSHAELYEMLLAIGQGLLDDPEDITLQFVLTNPPTFRILVPSQFVGRLVGKDGKTARAICLLADACIHKYGEKASVDIQPNPPN